jgi:hypothetical protein
MAACRSTALRSSLGGMLKVDQVHVLRHKVLVEGRSQRQVAKELGRNVPRSDDRVLRDRAVVGTEHAADSLTSANRASSRLCLAKIASGEHR